MGNFQKRFILLSIFFVLVMCVSLALPNGSGQVYAQTGATNTPTRTPTATATTTPQAQNQFYTREYNWEGTESLHVTPSVFNYWLNQVNVDPDAKLLAVVRYGWRSTSDHSDWCNYQNGVQGRQSAGEQWRLTITSWGNANTTVRTWAIQQYPATSTVWEIGNIPLTYNMGFSGTYGGYSCSMRIILIYMGTDPTANCYTVLVDGGMEQNPISNAWFGAGGQAYYDFGRIINDPVNQALFGAARCERGMHLIGSNVCNTFPPGNINRAFCQLRYGSKAFGNIRQRFRWTGGTLYFRFSSRGLPTNGLDRNMSIEIYVLNNTTGVRSNLFIGLISPEWKETTGSSVGSLSAGDYTVYVMKGAGNEADDNFLIDDVIISACPVTGAQCQHNAALTPTPTLQATATNLPPGTAGDNLILNCGFQQGDAFWNISAPNSFVVYDISGNNYAHNNSNTTAPGFSQSFYWPGGTAYVSFRTNTSYNVYFINNNTGVTYPVLNALQVLSGWVTWRSTVNMPAGAYSIVLFTTSAQPSNYDLISVAQGNYGACASNGADATATPLASPTQNATATMWPTSTQRPTSTPIPGGPTSTARPTNTPYPTYTVRPTNPPTITPNPFYTPTALPTYTRQPTYTPYPTYTMPPTSTTNPGEATSTPPPTYTPPPQTPTPPVPPPPPGYYADCNRPQNGGDIAWWTEYQKCQILSFFSMSPNAVGTVVAVPTLFAGAEPFGSINELDDTNQRIKALVDSYDMNGQHLPGVDNLPDPGQFINGPGNGSPWTNGPLIGNNHGTTSDQCSARITTVIGPNLSKGMCLFFNFLADHGITPWLQLFINLAAIGFLGVYFWKKWIDAGSN